MSSYPTFPARVVGFCYCDDLHLARSITAVKCRKGEDADYVVAKDYKCVIAVEPKNGDEYDHHITVPAGFLTDLSTVPWFARWLVSRVGPHLEASIIHDWLFVAWQHECLTANEQMRFFADDVFLAAMEKAEVPRWKRRLIYRASQGCGQGAFYGREDRLFTKKSSAPGSDVP